MTRMRNRLAVALLEITAAMTVDEVADITKEPRATVGRRLKALRETGGLGMWTAVAVDALAAYEADRLRSTKISDALRPEQPVGEIADPQEVIRQVHRTQRDIGSLQIGCDEAGNMYEVDDRGRHRLVTMANMVTKTDKAIRSTADQHGILVRFRAGLMRRLKGRS